MRWEALAVLGRSVATKIRERTEALAVLEGEIHVRGKAGFENEDATRALVAEAATHRRELRQTRLELERLGCSVVGREPLTLRIPSRLGSKSISCVWQVGAPVRWA